MSEIKVSINVAVYNTSKHLRQCLDSLVNQTLKEIEIILVDDGSTDDSGLICDEYAAKDPRVEVIHKQNGGLASARQKGFLRCRGEYIICCDSDDWVELNMYEELYKSAQRTGSDMVMCAYYCNYPDGKQTVVDCEPSGYSEIELLRQILVGKIPGSSCNKMWRRSFYEEHNLFWEPGVNLGEDGLMFMKQLQYPVSMSYLNVSLYHYRRDNRSQSYTNNLSMNSFKQLEWIDEWKNTHLSKEMYSRELFIGKINLGYQGFRVKDMPELYHKNYLSQEIKTVDIVRYRFFTLKSLLVLVAKICYPCAHFLYGRFYQMFYK